MRRDQVLAAGSGVPDADADAAKIGAEARVDRAQAVVPRSAATLLHLHLERREIELIVEHGQRIDVELVEAQRLLNGIAAVVHECERLEQKHAVAADPAFRDQAAEFLGPRREAVDLCDDVCGHESDIVPVQRILRTRIAKADPHLHRGSLAGAVPKKKPPSLSAGRLFCLSKA